MLTFVWAQDLQGNIGYQGHLPWHLPADLKHFKEVTGTDPMIMGRTTFDSLGRILPNRLHVVLTKDQDLIMKYQANKSVLMFDNEEDLVAWTKNNKSDMTVIGGRSVFKIFLPMVDRLNCTVVDGIFPADTKMIKIDYHDFDVIEKTFHESDDKNRYNYTNYLYTKKSK